MSNIQNIRIKKYKYYLCKECVSLKKQRLYNADPNKYRKYAHKQRLKHYDKIIKRDRDFKFSLKVLMTIPEYEILLKSQNNLCAICNNP